MDALSSAAVRCCRWRVATAFFLASLASEARSEAPRQALPEVVVSASAAEPVEKSYRKMVRGMDYFEAERRKLAPDASLRFKLLPRKDGTTMDAIDLEIVGGTFSRRVPIASDRTFTLARDEQAMREDAVVSPNRKRMSMTWRAEVRSPGLPAGTRRLGDLRLECEVGIEADLVSNSRLIGRIADLFRSARSYCDRANTEYLFFAERALFSVTLVHGARQEILATDRLYARASDDPELGSDLPYCDCEVLVDRTYYLPLGDHTWPDDTRVEFEYMDGPG